MGAYYSITEVYSEISFLNYNYFQNELSGTKLKLKNAIEELDKFKWENEILSLKLDQLKGTQQ